MSFFYSLFLGFIMGDIGYGLVMILGGGFIWYKQRARESGFKRLAGVFAVGGLFAVVWGILFNSFFGVSLPFLKAVMPDAQSDNWTFIGISVPSVLIISLLIGIVQLFAGYMCRAAQEWAQGAAVGWHLGRRGLGCVFPRRRACRHRTYRRGARGFVGHNRGDRGGSVFGGGRC